MTKILTAAFVVTALIGGAIAHSMDQAPVEQCVAQHTSSASTADDFTAAYAECDNN